MRGLLHRSPRVVPVRRGVLVVALVGAAALAVTAPACGPDPVGVEDCRRIEKVRCESAPPCGIDLTRPVHSGDSAANDVAACIRYYDDQCLHGLVLEKAPARADVDACVNAIVNGDCSIVQKPETHAACAFLVPAPTATPDSGSDAAADAATDASAD